MAESVELYLVRHAIAAERGDDWPDDDLRPLTAEGVKRFREVVIGLRSVGVELEVVFSSPLVRARQTATLLVEGTAPRPLLKILPALSPGSTPADVLAAAAKATRRRRIAFVGHEPDLGALAASLLGARRSMAFKKGGIARIDLPRLAAGTRGTLAWFAPPKLLRRGDR